MGTRNLGVPVKPAAAEPVAKRYPAANGLRAQAGCPGGTKRNKGRWRTAAAKDCDLAGPLLPKRRPGWPSAMSIELPGPVCRCQPESVYWTQSRRPLTSLVFTAPLLVIYEAGVMLLGPQAVRNGADVWLRGLLEAIDFGQYFLLPALVVAILLGWHYTTRDPWRVSRPVLSGMFLESLVLALCLRGILQIEAVVLRGLGAVLVPTDPLCQWQAEGPGSLARLIGFIGAGVYEELLFRLMLLSALAWAFRHAGVRPRTAAAGAVAATGLAFALAHYLGPYGEPIEPERFLFWYGFVFRILAGVFFGVLFLLRGFGIAVGTHAAYDLLVRLG